MKASAKLRQSVLLRARETFMRSIGRSVLAVFFLMLQEVLCVMFASGVAERAGAISTVMIAGYPFNWLSYVILFLLTALFGPIMLGVSEYFLVMLRTRNAKIGNIFSWFSDSDKLRRGLDFGLFYALITVFVSLLCNEIPAAVLQRAGYSLSDMTSLFITKDLAPNRAAITLNAISTGASVLLQIPLLYLLATGYIMVDSPSKGVFQAVHESANLMRGHIWSYILTLLRILPLLFLISGCGFLIVIGYGFYYMVRTAYVDILLIQSYLGGPGYSYGTPPDVPPEDNPPGGGPFDNYPPDDDPPSPPPEE